MENLFCDRDISNKFDLKGSERNRMVDPSNQNNQNGEIVLLDENLIQSKYIFELNLQFIINLYYSSVLVKAAVHSNTQPNNFTRSNKSRCIIFRKKLCHGLFIVSWIGYK